MNKDDYWNGDDIVNQMVHRAIPISNFLWPRSEYRVVWAFDQSTGHGKFAPNALKASNMNLNPGGLKPVLRDGWYMDKVRDSEELFKYTCALVFEIDNTPLTGWNAHNTRDVSH